VVAVVGRPSNSATWRLAMGGAEQGFICHGGALAVRSINGQAMPAGGWTRAGAVAQTPAGSRPGGRKGSWGSYDLAGIGRAPELTDSRLTVTENETNGIYR